MTSLPFDPVKPFLASAPLAGISDSAYRQLCRHFGADLVWTEMVSATGLFYKREKIGKWLANGSEHRIQNTESSDNIFRDISFGELQKVITGKVPVEVNILRFKSFEQPIVVQLFGKQPEHFKLAAQMLAQIGFAGVDINMGCPARKVISSFHGASLMQDSVLAAELVLATKEGISQAKGTSVPVSVKIRSGWDSVIAPEFAQVLQEAGADFITVHARTKQQGFKGKADWEVIKEVVESVSIPVIGNGDVIDVASAFALLEQTGCAGIMIGRGAVGRPWLFAEVQDGLGGANSREQLNSGFGHFADRQLDTAYEHCRLLVRMKGEERGMREARKHLAWYIKGFPGAAGSRARLVRVENLEQAHAILHSLANV